MYAICILRQPEADLAKIQKKIKIVFYSNLPNGVIGPGGTKSRSSCSFLHKGTSSVPDISSLKMVYLTVSRYLNSGPGTLLSGYREGPRRTNVS